MANATQVKTTVKVALPRKAGLVINKTVKSSWWSLKEFSAGLAGKKEGYIEFGSEEAAE